MIYFERFGRKRKYALGKTSGKANIEKIFRVRIKTKCGRSKISYQRIIELGDKKKPLLGKTLYHL
jgi:D-citramalate synthase